MSARRWNSKYTPSIALSSGHDPAPTNEPLNPLHVWSVVLPRRRTLPAYPLVRHSLTATPRSQQTPIPPPLHVGIALPHNRTMSAQSLARNAKAPPDDGGHPSWGPEEGSPPLWGCPFKIGTSICGVLVRSSWSMAKMSHY